ncbi:hypothetical protein ABIA33_007554 [Streptacidiphilus sp. MAP12-16]|uniref:hypothetical protein n=1 Tax=Streptacidiphilus sp. MAP12-16 TaxID=3156300 RepID=UPI0035127638
MTQRPVSLVSAFPAALGVEAAELVALLSPARIPVHEAFAVVVGGEVLVIPGRMYADEPEPGVVAGLSPVQLLQLACLYTRHHDGYVRQRHLRQIIGRTEPWVVPFVVQLLGEYVLEILNDLAQGLRDLGVPGSELRRAFGRFVVENPEFFARTERRVVSYYSCYHRWHYADFSSYPLSALLDALRTAAGEQAGAPWPGHTPRARCGQGRRP